MTLFIPLNLLIICLCHFPAVLRPACRLEGDFCYCDIQIDARLMWLMSFTLLKLKSACVLTRFVYFTDTAYFEGWCLAFEGRPIQQPLTC